jgi:hypothetical protein
VGVGVGLLVEPMLTLTRNTNKGQGFFGDFGALTILQFFWFFCQ